MKRLYHYPSMLILNILAVFALLIFEMSMFVRLVLFKPDIYSEMIGRENIGGIVYDEITEYLTWFSAPTGIPPEVYNDPIDKAAIVDGAYALTRDSIAYLSDPNAPDPIISFDFTAVDKNITDYIVNYSQSNEIAMDDEAKKLIDNTLGVVHQQIENRLDVLMLYKLSTSSYGKTLHTYAGVIKMVMIGSGVLLAAIAALMLFIDRRHPRDLPYWFGTILFCSSLTALVPSLYLKWTKYFDGFFIRSEHIYKSVTNLCWMLLERIIDFQFVMLLLGVALILLTIIIHMFYLKYIRRKNGR